MKAFGSTIVVLLLATGVGLIAYARWTTPLKDADAALAEGRFEEAVIASQIAEARFDALPAAKQIVPGEYNRAVANHLLALYRLKRYDEVIDVAQKAPAAASPTSCTARRNFSTPSPK